MRLTWVHFFFGYEGRLNRAAYWLFLLAAATASMTIMILLARHLGMSLHDFSMQVQGHGMRTAVGRQAIFLMIPVWLLVGIPGIAVGVKRLHDRNHSGWWLLAFGYAPWLVDFTLHALGDPLARWPQVDAAHKLVFMIIGIGMLVELGILRGTAGDNRYGPDPLALPQDVF